MSDWKHPTGKQPKTVLLHALGPTRHDLYDLHCRHEPMPDLMQFDELWSLNSGVNLFGGRVQYDLLWVMDNLEGEARRLPAYMDHLMAWSDRFNAPIITSDAGRWRDAERVHEYPLADVVKHYGRKHLYFHNSIPFIIAYACWIGVERLTMFGVDYDHPTLKGNEEDRPNAEYWVGVARAMGMDVIVPNTTTLLNARKGTWIYGYPNNQLPPLPPEEAA